jgi:hypothetical protein
MTRRQIQTFGNLRVLQVVEAKSSGLSAGLPQCESIDRRIRETSCFPVRVAVIAARIERAFGHGLKATRCAADSG